MEVWKDINGYEGLYQVSNLGNVRSMERRVVNHKSGATRIINGAPIKPWNNGNGYLAVALRKKHNKRKFFVHRLVAEHFIENPSNLAYVNHVDYDISNNKACNLQWCTQKENIAHSIEHLRKPKSKCKSTNTGEKYISMKKRKNESTAYRVYIRSRNVCKVFGKLSDAVAFRNGVIEQWQNQ